MVIFGQFIYRGIFPNRLLALIARGCKREAVQNFIKGNRSLHWLRMKQVSGRVRLSHFDPDLDLGLVKGQEEGFPRHSGPFVINDMVREEGRCDNWQVSLVSANFSATFFPLFGRLLTLSMGWPGRNYVRAGRDNEQHLEVEEEDNLHEPVFVIWHQFKDHLNCFRDLVGNYIMIG